jgi:hypothetical protein
VNVCNSRSGVVVVLYSLSCRSGDVSVATSECELTNRNVGALFGAANACVEV